MNSVLRYPGSKWAMANKMNVLIPQHHTYLEPFFGSGALFFTKQPSDIEMINDIDNEVINLFECIKSDAERLARITLTTPFSRKIYDRAFENNSMDPFERASSFLIRCWQGHGFRTNGYKVGWKNDVQGRERMYALWNWYRLPEWIIQIAERLRTVQIDNKPAIELIERFDYPNVFMYLDPPYLLSTRSAKQYMWEMTEDDHEELLKAIHNSAAQIMISGYESDLYNDLLTGWNKISFPATAEYGLKRVETVWMNYEIGQMKIEDYLIEKRPVCMER